MPYRVMHRIIVHPAFVDILSRFIPALSFDPTVQIEEVAKVSVSEHAVI